MGIFHCYVSLPEGNPSINWCRISSINSMLGKGDGATTTPWKQRTNFPPWTYAKGPKWKFYLNQPSIFRGELLVLGRSPVLCTTYFIVGQDSFNLFRPLFSDKERGTILEKVRWTSDIYRDCEFEVLHASHTNKIQFICPSRRLTACNGDPVVCGRCEKLSDKMQPEMVDFCPEESSIYVPWIGQIDYSKWRRIWSSKKQPFPAGCHKWLGESIRKRPILKAGKKYLQNGFLFQNCPC